MLTPLTGKDKAARVPLNYFRQPRRARKVAILAALGVAGIAAVVSLASGYWRQAASPGPLHMVHSAWDNDCAVCHRLGEPTSSHNGLQTMVGTGKVADELCIHCHAGTAHHPQHVIWDEVPHCSGCHIEHRGRTSMLSSVPDSTCTRCHRDLSAHSKDKPDYTNKITRFERDHPQFRLGDRGKRKELGQAGDPGKLKFNHKVHLMPGILFSKNDAGGVKIEDIKDKALRERYRKEQPKDKQGDKDLVELTCFSCHQLDITDAPKVGPRQEGLPRASGEYILPVNYDQHCKACHPLTFDPNLPDIQVPHHVQPPDVRRFLWGVFAGQEVRAIEKKEAEKKPAITREMPGLNIGREQKEARERIGGMVASAEKFLYQSERDKALKFIFPGKTTCGECHYYNTKLGELIPDSIEPPRVPQLWYTHAKFSHYAHRAVGCETCHEGAKESTKHTDVLLPGIKNCLECHSSSRTEKGQKFGGVRQDCTTCHRYHQGDVPEAGIGAKARGPETPRSIQEFLNPTK